MGKQAEAEQGRTQQTPSERMALRGQTRPQGAEHEAFFRKSREDRCPMAMFRMQGTELDHQTGLQIMPEGQASRAHAPKASSTTLGEWCQQGCPAHLLRSGGQRREHGSQKPRQRQSQGGQGGGQRESRVPAAGARRPARRQLASPRLRGPAAKSAGAARRQKKQRGQAGLCRTEEPEEDETVPKLGLADVHDLRNLLHNLQARIHNSSEAERPAQGTTRERARPSPRTTRRSCTEPWPT